MFNMGDETYKKRPPIISKDTIIAVSEFLKAGCERLGINEVVIGFHGGEPLMQKKHDFAESCEIFNHTLQSIAKVKYTMQTNAMLLNEEWLALLNKYDVSLGISIDGTKEDHDKARVDHKGRGSYDRVAKKIALLRNSTYAQSLNFGLLCVINPDNCAKTIYRHFVDDLKATHIDFLLPLYNHNHTLPHSVSAYTDFLSVIFDEWVKDDNPDIHIRCFNSTLEVFLGGTSHIYGEGRSQLDELPLISISSAGDLSPTDELRATDPSINYSDATVFNTSLADYLQQPIFTQLKNASISLPHVCTVCEWQPVCNGGSLVNRYHQDNHFDNPSIYCSGLKEYYEKIADYLKQNLNHKGALS